MEYNGYRYYIQDDRLDDGRWVYDFMRQKHCDVRGRFQCKDKCHVIGGDYYKTMYEIMKWLKQYGVRVQIYQIYSSFGLLIAETRDKERSHKSARFFAIDEGEMNYINVWEFSKPERLSVHAYETYVECLAFAKEYMEDLTRENEGEQLSLFDV